MLFFNNTLRSFKVKKFIIDRLLFPKDFFKKITDKLHTLYIGIVLIGLVDLGMSLIYKIPFYFYNKPTEILVYNISLALCIIILVGLLDIIFFAMPLFDIFKNFALRKRITDIKGQFIKLMKVYIVSHFLIIPLYILLHLVFKERILGLRIYSGFFLIFKIIIIFWQSAIITRGIYIIYTFHKKLKSLVFFMVSTWVMVLGYTIDYLVSTLLTKLFM
jgi:hypothetical protein